MDNIIEPNEFFDFTKLSLAHPSGIQGGAYFTKIEHNKKPLYIQTCKSLTRQGFVKTGKKYYCDLMFDKNSESLINWFEKLEEKCQKLIYEKKDDWFQGNLEESDIETAFNSLLRVYRSGKYYLLRTNIKNNKDDTPAVKIYNEKEHVLGMADITTSTEIISVLEIQGIKFTSRNFQIEIELKQMMVLDNEPIFESCVIKTRKPQTETQTHVLDETTITAMPDPVLEDLEPSVIANETPAPINDLEEMPSLDLLGEEEVKKEPEPENLSLNIEFEDLAEDIPTDELREVAVNELNLDKDDLAMTLKKPNQVYFELYKEARSKAKQAKKNAILAYLEAKNIKKTYMLENINDSDSDFDAEIDEVSESELEGL